MAHGWDFTAKQTQSSTGQTTLCWAAIVHGTLVNRTVHQQKSVATSGLQAPEKESGMTHYVNGRSHGLHMLQWFSAKENLTKQTKLSGFSLQQVSSIVGQLLKLDKRLTN